MLQTELQTEWLCNSAGENSPPSITAVSLNTGRKLWEKCSAFVQSRGPCITVLTRQGGVSLLVLVCGQWRDKLSILSVTAAASPSGITGGRLAGGRTQASSPLLHQAQVLVCRTAGHWESDCNLLPLLMWSEREAEHQVIYSVRKINGCHDIVLQMAKVSLWVPV